MIVPEADLDQFMVNDDGCGLEDVVVKRKNTVKPVFSSPQNRRSSLLRNSQKSHSSAASRQSKGNSMALRGGRGSIDKGVIRIGQGSVHGVGSDPITGSVPLGLTAPTTASSEADVAVSSGTENFPREVNHEEALSEDGTNGVTRIEKVLGTLPIFLVDDSVAILKMTKRAIQNECANINIMEAKNGEEAFNRVVEAFSSFELIIIDIQMPICDGFQFTRKVRQRSTSSYWQQWPFCW